MLPSRTTSLSSFPLSLVVSGVGADLDHICKGRGQAWPEELGPANTPRPQLVRPSGEVSWARSEASVSSASDNRGVFWQPECLQGRGCQDNN